MFLPQTPCIFCEVNPLVVEQVEPIRKRAAASGICWPKTWVENWSFRRRSSHRFTSLTFQKAEIPVWGMDGTLSGLLHSVRFPLRSNFGLSRRASERQLHDRSTTFVARPPTVQGRQQQLWSSWRSLCMRGLRAPSALASHAALRNLSSSL